MADKTTPAIEIGAAGVPQPIMLTIKPARDTTTQIAFHVICPAFVLVNQFQMFLATFIEILHINTSATMSNTIVFTVTRESFFIRLFII